MDFIENDFWISLKMTVSDYPTSSHYVELHPRNDVEPAAEKSNEEYDSHSAVHRYHPSTHGTSLTASETLPEISEFFPNAKSSAHNDNHNSVHNVKNKPNAETNKKQKDSGERKSVAVTMEIYSTDSEVSDLESNPFYKRLLKSPPLIPKTQDSDHSINLNSDLSPNSAGKRKFSYGESAEQHYNTRTPPESPSKKQRELSQPVPNTHGPFVKSNDSFGRGLAFNGAQYQNDSLLNASSSSFESASEDNMGSTPVSASEHSSYGNYQISSEQSAISESDESDTSIPREVVIIHRLPGEKLGMVIRMEGGKEKASQIKHVVVKHVTPGGAADRATGGSCGLCARDKILQLNGIDLSNLTRGECIAVFREMPLRLLLCIQRHCRVRTKKQSYDISSASNLSNGSSESHSDVLSPEGFQRHDMVIHKRPGEASLGLSIVASYGSTKQFYQIKRLLPSGVCFKSGQLQPGDRLVSCNSQPLHDIALAQCLGILRSAGQTVNLRILRSMENQASMDQAVSRSNTSEIPGYSGKGLPDSSANDSALKDSDYLSSDSMAESDNVIDLDELTSQHPNPVAGELFAQSGVKLSYSQPFSQTVESSDNQSEISHDKDYSSDNNSILDISQPETDDEVQGHMNIKSLGITRKDSAELLNEGDTMNLYVTASEMFPDTKIGEPSLVLNSTQKPESSHSELPSVDTTLIDLPPPEEFSDDQPSSYVDVSANESVPYTDIDALLGLFPSIPSVHGDRDPFSQGKSLTPITEDLKEPPSAYSTHNARNDHISTTNNMKNQDESILIDFTKTPDNEIQIEQHKGNQQNINDNRATVADQLLDNITKLSNVRRDESNPTNADTSPNMSAIQERPSSQNRTVFSTISTQNGSSTCHVSKVKVTSESTRSAYEAFQDTNGEHVSTVQVTNICQQSVSVSVESPPVPRGHDDISSKDSQGDLLKSDDEEEYDEDEDMVAIREEWENLLNEASDSEPDERNSKDDVKPEVMSLMPKTDKTDREMSSSVMVEHREEMSGSAADDIGDDDLAEAQSIKEAWDNLVNAEIEGIKTVVCASGAERGVTEQSELDEAELIRQAFNDSRTVTDSTVPSDSVLPQDVEISLDMTIQENVLQSKVSVPDDDIVPMFQTKPVNEDDIIPDIMVKNESGVQSLIAAPAISEDDLGSNAVKDYVPTDQVKEDLIIPDVKVQNESAISLPANPSSVESVTIIPADFIAPLAEGDLDSSLDSDPSTAIEEDEIIPDIKPRDKSEIDVLTSAKNDLKEDIPKEPTEKSDYDSSSETDSSDEGTMVTGDAIVPEVKVKEKPANDSDNEKTAITEDVIVPEIKVKDKTADNIFVTTNGVSEEESTPSEPPQASDSDSSEDTPESDTDTSEESNNEEPVVTEDVIVPEVKIKDKLAVDVDISTAEAVIVPEAKVREKPAVAVNIGITEDIIVLEAKVKDKPINDVNVGVSEDVIVPEIKVKDKTADDHSININSVSDEKISRSDLIVPRTVSESDTSEESDNEEPAIIEDEIVPEVKVKDKPETDVEIGVTEDVIVHEAKVKDKSTVDANILSEEDVISNESHESQSDTDSSTESESSHEDMAITEDIIIPQIKASEKSIKIPPVDNASVGEKPNLDVEVETDSFTTESFTSETISMKSDTEHESSSTDASSEHGEISMFPGNQESKEALQNVDDDAILESSALQESIIKSASKASAKKSKPVNVSTLSTPNPAGRSGNYERLASPRLYSPRSTFKSTMFSASALVAPKLPNYQMRCEEEPFQVDIMKGILGLGMKLKMDADGHAVVSEIQRNGLVDKNGVIKVGDFIVSVNSTELSGLSQNKVDLLIQLLARGVIKIIVSVSPPVKVEMRSNTSDYSSDSSDSAVKRASWNPSLASSLQRRTDLSSTLPTSFAPLKRSSWTPQTRKSETSAVQLKEIKTKLPPPVAPKPSKKSSMENAPIKEGSYNLPGKEMSGVIKSAAVELVISPEKALARNSLNPAGVDFKTTASKSMIALEIAQPRNATQHTPGNITTMEIENLNLPEMAPPRNFVSPTNAISKVAAAETVISPEKAAPRSFTRPVDVTAEVVKEDKIISPEIAPPRSFISSATSPDKVPPRRKPPPVAPKPAKRTSSTGSEGSDIVLSPALLPKPFVSSFSSQPNILIQSREVIQVKHATPSEQSPVQVSLEDSNVATPETVIDTKSDEPVVSKPILSPRSSVGYKSSYVQSAKNQNPSETHFSYTYPEAKPFVTHKTSDGYVRSAKKVVGDEKEHTHADKPAAVSKYVGSYTSRQTKSPNEESIIATEIHVVASESSNLNADAKGHINPSLAPKFKTPVVQPRRPAFPKHNYVQSAVNLSTDSTDTSSHQPQLIKLNSDPRNQTSKFKGLNIPGRLSTPAAAPKGSSQQGLKMTPIRSFNRALTPSTKSPSVAHIIAKQSMPSGSFKRSGKESPSAAEKNPGFFEGKQDVVSPTNVPESLHVEPAPVAPPKVTSPNATNKEVSQEDSIKFGNKAIMTDVKISESPSPDSGFTSSVQEFEVGKSSMDAVSLEFGIVSSRPDLPAFSSYPDTKLPSADSNNDPHADSSITIDVNLQDGSFRTRDRKEDSSTQQSTVEPKPADTVNNDEDVIVIPVSIKPNFASVSVDKDVLVPDPPVPIDVATPPLITSPADSSSKNLLVALHGYNDYPATVADVDTKGSILAQKVDDENGEVIVDDDEKLSKIDDDDAPPPLPGLPPPLPSSGPPGRFDDAEDTSTDESEDLPEDIKSVRQSDIVLESNEISTPVVEVLHDSKAVVNEECVVKTNIKVVEKSPDISSENNDGDNNVTGAIEMSVPSSLVDISAFPNLTQDIYLHVDSTDTPQTVESSLSPVNTDSRKIVSAPVSTTDVVLECTVSGQHEIDVSLLPSTDVSAHPTSLERADTDQFESLLQDLDGGELPVSDTTESPEVKTFESQVNYSSTPAKSNFLTKAQDVVAVLPSIADTSLDFSTDSNVNENSENSHADIIPIDEMISDISSNQNSAEPILEPADEIKGHEEHNSTKSILATSKRTWSVICNNNPNSSILMTSANVSQNVDVSKLVDASLISPEELARLIDEASETLNETSASEQEEIIVAIIYLQPHDDLGIHFKQEGNGNILISEVVSGGSLSSDELLNVNDRVLSVNGHSMKNTSPSQVDERLQQFKSHVILVISREPIPIDSGYFITPLVDSKLKHLDNNATENASLLLNTSSDIIKNKPAVINEPTKEQISEEKTPKYDMDKNQSIESMNKTSVESQDTKADVVAKSSSSDSALADDTFEVVIEKGYTGLGFLVEGGLASPLGDRPVTIKKIFSKLASKCENLRVDDEIIKVNNVDMSKMKYYEVRSHLKFLSDGKVTLLIRKQH